MNCINRWVRTWCINIISLWFSFIWITFRRIELVRLGGVHAWVLTNRSHLHYVTWPEAWCCAVAWCGPASTDLLLQKNEKSDLLYTASLCLFFSIDTQTHARTHAQTHMESDVCGWCAADTFHDALLSQRWHIAVVIRPPHTHSLYHKHWATFINLLS